MLFSLDLQGHQFAEDERNTYAEFGYPLKEEGYLDKYFIDDSQKMALPYRWFISLDSKNYYMLKKTNFDYF